MRRYWILIVLVPLIVLCVGAYYVQADSRYPEFVLEKQEGDEKEAAAVLLRGQFGQNHRQGAVTVGLQGSEYSSEQSFFARIAPRWGREEIKKLAEEHRNFIRGKRNPLSFYEDDNLLAYADVTGDFSNSGLYNFRFAVSLLDKKNGRSSSYEVSVPNGNLYTQINVYDVQAIGGQLKAVTQNYKSDGSSEIHLYSLALTNGQAPVDQILLQSENADSNILGGYEANALRPSRYVVFHAVQFHKVQNAHGDYSREEAGGRLFVFNIENGQEVRIESPEISDLLSGGARQDAFSINSEGDNLFLAKKTGQGVRLIQYNIPEAKISVKDIQTDFVVYTTVKNGRLYMLVKKNTDREELPSLAVADAGTGNLLFKGSISLKESEPRRTGEFSKLFIHDLLVK